MAGEVICDRHVGLRERGINCQQHDVATIFMAALHGRNAKSEIRLGERCAKSGRVGSL
jgi:hypothetical protein